nr:hypothetical protein GCM10017611_76080 [Rhodococcus wratislaviensis]
MLVAAGPPDDEVVSRRPDGVVAVGAGPRVSITAGCRVGFRAPLFGLYFLTCNPFPWSVRRGFDGRQERADLCGHRGA